MKTKPPVKLPKAQPIPSIMYAAYDARPGRGKIALVRYDKKLALGSVSSSFRIIPCAVLPCRNRQGAREIVRLFTCGAVEFTARNSQGHLLESMRKSRP